MTEILRRTFIAIATASYEDENYPPLPVAAEVAQLTRWLCDQDRMGDRAFVRPPDLDGLAANPDREDISKALADAKGAVQRWNSHDAAVVFVTGHGQVQDGGQHWTILKQSKFEAPVLQSLRTEDLVGWLAATGIEYLLLIIDTCFAEASSRSFSNRDSPVPANWLILPSAMRNETAEATALTRAIGKAVEDVNSEIGGRWSDHEYFTPTQFVGMIKRHLDSQQTVRPSFGGEWDKAHFCLPNPHYLGSAGVVTERSRHELALPKKDLQTHWGPRSRGVARDEVAGWLFTGRAALMEELIRAVTGEPGGTTLVTGSAGCGKSAVLARLVTLSDPAFRAGYREQVAGIPGKLQPAEGAVDVAILASRKRPQDILGQLFEALAVPVPSGTGWDALNPDSALTAWSAWLGRRDAPVTIVLDALDEADDPPAVAELLARLAEGGNGRRMRLLVGVRSPGEQDSPLAGAGNSGALADGIEASLAARRLRVDNDPWWNQDDISAYVTSILGNTQGSPYAGDEHAELATSVASVLSSRSGRSFLFARLAATQLTEGAGVIDPADQRWLAAIDDGVIGVFREDLWQAFPEDHSQRVGAVTLLRAVAFGYGRGLPWLDIWPAVANAIAGRPNKYGDRDIADLLKSRMSGYLVRESDGDDTVYRLFHEVLRTTLREDWQQLLLDPEALVQA